MNHQVKAIALIALLCAVTIGCSTADNPTSAPTASVGQGRPNTGHDGPGIGFQKMQEDIQKRMTSLPGLEHMTDPTGKGGTAQADYDNNHWFYEYPDGFGARYIYNYDYTWQGPSGDDWVHLQLIQVYYEKWGEGIPAHSVIIPMNDDNYHSLTDLDNNLWHGGWTGSGYVDEHQVTFSFVENDAETGLTGIKIDFDIQSPFYPAEWGYGEWYDNYYVGYFYCYRYAIKPEYWQYVYGYDYPSENGYTYYTDFFPEFIETDYGFIQDGEGSSIGPYWGPDEWNGGGQTHSLSGTVFYDLNGNGTQDGGEPGINGANVTLSDVGSTTSDGDGNYSFADLEEGTYTVSCDAISGFSATTATSVEVELSADSEVDFGFAIDFDSFGGSSENSQGMGWWKHNIGRAAAGNARGVQISAAACEALRASLANFAYAALNFGSLADANTALSYNGGNAASRLAQHLTASEYNYANGAYLDGDAQLTWGFVVWGEYLVENSGSFTSAELNAAKDLFEGYNEGLIQ